MKVIKKIPSKAVLCNMIFRYQPWTAIIIIIFIVLWWNLLIYHAEGVKVIQSIWSFGKADGHIISTKRVSQVLCEPFDNFFCHNESHYSLCLPVHSTAKRYVDLTRVAGKALSCGEGWCCNLGGLVPCTRKCEAILPKYLNYDWNNRENNEHPAKKNRKHRIVPVIDDFEEYQDDQRPIKNLEKIFVDYPLREIGDRPLKIPEEECDWQPSYRSFCQVYPLKSVWPLASSTTTTTTTTSTTTTTTTPPPPPTTTRKTTISTTTVPPLTTSLRCTVPPPTKRTTTKKHPLLSSTATRTKRTTTKKHPLLSSTATRTKPTTGLKRATHSIRTIDRSTKKKFQTPRSEPTDAWPPLQRRNAHGTESFFPTELPEPPQLPFQKPDFNNYGRGMQTSIYQGYSPKDDAKPDAFNGWCPGIGYYTHPFYCDKYISCHRINKVMKMATIVCPPGTLFDRDLRECTKNAKCIYTNANVINDKLLYKIIMGNKHAKKRFRKQSKLPYYIEP